MILHAASMAAVFVDQVTQAPAVFQCVQVAPESWLKWLLPTIVQTVVSLLSIFAGVGIAVRSFRVNKETEHEQWVRDQKKAEWKELLIKVAAIEEIIPCVAPGLPNYEPLNDAVLAVLPLLRGNLFAYGAVESSGFIGKWESYARFASGIVDTIKGDNSVQKDPPELLNPGDKEASSQSRKADERTVRMKLHELREELRTLARKDLGI